MTEAFSGNLEVAIVLPLSVVSNQLLRIESDLRLLHMKAFHVARERDNGHSTQSINARLDAINASLDAIKELVAEFGADIHPRPPAAAPKRGPDRDD
jgi:hypothetical protein